MTNRVNELGALWWDWLGIVITIALVVTTGYRITTAWHEARRQLRNELYSTFYQFRQLWLKSLSKARKKAPYRKNLIPLVTQWGFRISKYMFLLGVMVSFLIGMFHSVSVGALSLGYSTAIAFGFGLLIISIWRLSSALATVCFHVFGRKKETAGATLPDQESGHTPRKPSKAFRLGYLMAKAPSHCIARALSPIIKLAVEFFCGGLIFATIDEFWWELFTYLFPEQDKGPESLHEGCNEAKASAGSTADSSAVAEKKRRKKHVQAALAAFFQSSRDTRGEAPADASLEGLSEAVSPQRVRMEYIGHRWQLQEVFLRRRPFW
jgi:hypothetical protein